MSAAIFSAFIGIKRQAMCHTHQNTQNKDKMTHKIDILSTFTDYFAYYAYKIHINGTPIQSPTPSYAETQYATYTHNMHTEIPHIETYRKRAKTALSKKSS